MEGRRELTGGELEVRRGSKAWRGLPVLDRASTRMGERLQQQFRLAGQTLYASANELLLLRRRARGEVMATNRRKFAVHAGSYVGDKM